MTLTSKIFKDYRSTVFTFLAVTIAALCIRPQGWLSYFGQEPYYFDVGNYLQISQDGYHNANMTVFSPVWPMFLNIFARLGLSGALLATIANFSALVLFLLSIRSFLRISDEIFSDPYRHYFNALYVFSPLAIFRIIGYTEALCCFLGCHLLLAFLNPKSSFLKVFALTFLLSLSRPFQMFFMVGAIGTYIYISFLRRPKTGLFKLFGATFSGAALAFLTMGLYCFMAFGDFLAPVHGQANWGRKLGFYPELFLNPKTVGGSDDVLIWDLVAMYGSFVLLLFLLLQLWSNRIKQSLNEAFAAVFCSLVSAELVIASVLTYERFMSLGRHVFGTPFFFFAFGSTISNLSTTSPKTKWFLRFLAFASFVYYVRFVLRYAKGSWAG